MTIDATHFWTRCTTSPWQCARRRRAAARLWPSGSDALNAKAAHIVRRRKPSGSAKHVRLASAMRLAQGCQRRVDSATSCVGSELADIRRLLTSGGCRSQSPLPRHPRHLQEEPSAMYLHNAVNSSPRRCGFRHTRNAHRPSSPQLFTAATQRLAAWCLAEVSGCSRPLISTTTLRPLLSSTMKSIPRRCCSPSSSYRSRQACSSSSEVQSSSIRDTPWR